MGNAGFISSAVCRSEGERNLNHGQEQRLGLRWFRFRVLGFRVLGFRVKLLGFRV